MVLLTYQCRSQITQNHVETMSEYVIAEFIVLPSFEKEYGLRLLHDKSTNSFYLETIYISDFDPEKLFNKFPDNDVLVRESIDLYRDSLRKTIVSDRFYTMDSSVVRVAISELFANHIYNALETKINECVTKPKRQSREKMIVNSKGEEVKLVLVTSHLDGTKIIFGLINEAEVRWVSIHLSDAKDNELSDALSKMAADIISRQFNESKYIK